MVEIVGNATQFKRELESAVSSTNKANSSFQKFGKAAGVAGGILATGLAVGLDRSVKAAMAAQASTARLDAAFKTAGLSATAFAGQINKAESAGRGLGFENTDVRDSLGSLVVATHSVSQSMKELGVAEDLARFKHVDLTTATRAMTMAQAGSTRALKQLGITITPVKTAEDALKLAHMKTGTAAYFAAEAHAKLLDKTATLREVIDKTTAATRGQAQAFANTAQGGAAQLHAQLTGLEESLGQMLLPAITAVSTKLAEFAGYLAKHKALAEGLVIGLGALSAALLATSVATKIMGLAMQSAAVAEGEATAAMELNPVFAITTALVLLGGGIYELIKHWGQVTDAMKEVWGYIEGTFLGAWHDVTHTLQEVKDWTAGHWPEIAVLISGPFAPVVALATNAFGLRDTLLGAFRTIKNDITSWGGHVVDFFKGLPGDIGDAIAGAFGALESAVKDLFSWKKIVGWIKDALGFGSPSPHFMAIGHDIVDSMARGVGAAEGILKTAVENLASKYVTGPITSFVTGGHQPQTKGGAPSANERIGQEMALSHGWGGAQWSALQALWTRESGWNQFAKNASSGAYGIPQALPESKLPAAGRQAGGSDVRSQIAWGLSYIAGRYGNPVGAWAHEQAYNWYGKGGVFTQPTVIGVGEKGPEAVVPLSRGGLGGGDIHVHVGTVIGTNLDQAARQLVEPLRRELYRHQARNTTLGFR